MHTSLRLFSIFEALYTIEIGGTEKYVEVIYTHRTLPRGSFLNSVIRIIIVQGPRISAIANSAVYIFFIILLKS